MVGAEMSRRRRRHGRGWALLALAAVLAGAWQALGPLRWVLIAPAAGMFLVAPVALVGSASAVPQLLVPRRIRMARRDGTPRPAIPRWLRRATYAADRYRCVYCGRRPGAQRDGSVVKLQWDHIIPWGFGGLTTLWNGATLCDRDNKITSNYWKSPQGKVYYGRWGHNMGQAGQILRAELRARYNPLRWVRAGCSWWIRQGR